jgi:TonB family protein
VAFLGRTGVWLALTLLLGWTSARADGFEGARSEVVDAGVHIPVLTKAPAIVSSVEPVYPEEAKPAQLAGDVSMAVDIAADGRVANVEVLQGSGHGFDEAAVAAVKQFVFSPAEIDNVPAAVRIQYTQHFFFTAPPPPDAGPPPDADVDAGPPAPVFPVAVKGKVLERGSRKPVAGAGVVVSLDGSVVGEPAVTEADGHFELRSPPGDVEIQVLDAKHQAFKTKETLKTGELLEVTYYVMPKSYGLYETVVKGEREKKEVTRRTLVREELEKVPGSLGDPIRVLTNLPGVARPPLIFGFLIVRGASPNDTGTYIDGVQLPLIYHFGGGPSVINPEFLDRIDFFPGGFGANYGRAIGGIVDVYTRPAKDNEFHGSAKIDLLDSGAYLSAPIVEGLTVSFAARRSYVDLVLKAVLPLVSSSAVAVAPQYYDYQARLTYRPTGSKHMFELFFLGSDDILTVASSDPANNFTVNNHTGFQRLVGTWIYRDGPLTVKTSPYVGLDEQSTGVGTIKIDTPAQIAGIRESIEYVIAPQATFRAGLDVQLTRSTYSFLVPNFIRNYRSFPGEQPDPSPTELTGRRDKYDYGEYGELEFNPGGGFHVIPSLRVDQYRVNGHTLPNMDPRLIFRQDLFDKEHRLTLKASVGLYSQLPTAIALDPENGNPNLGLERAFQSSLGAEMRITENINVDVTGFLNRRYDLAVRTADIGIAADGTPYRLNYNSQGEGRAFGVEVLLKHELTRNFFGWIAYTLSKSEERTVGKTAFQLATFDQTHILTLIGQYKFGNGWELGGRFRLTSGNPSTPTVDATFQADTLSFTPINGAAQSGRLPLFHQLDLRVDKTWLFDRWSLGAYLDVENVYNQSNQEFLLSDYRYRGQTVIPGVPIYPTLGVKGSF